MADIIPTLAVTPTPEPAPTPELVAFKDQIPAHWSIIALPGSEEIEAYNSTSNESFQGTMSDFNAALTAK